MRAPGPKRRKLCCTDDPTPLDLPADVLHHIASQYLAPRERSLFLCTSKVVLRAAATRVHLNAPKEAAICEADACEHLAVPGWVYPRAQHATITLSAVDDPPCIDPDKFPALRSIRLVIPRGATVPRDLRGRYTFGWRDEATAPVVTAISGSPAAIVQLVAGHRGSWDQVERVQIDATDSDKRLRAEELQLGLLNPIEISVSVFPSYGAVEWRAIPFLGTRTSGLTIHFGWRIPHFVATLGSHGALDTLRHITFSMAGFDLICNLGLLVPRFRENILSKCTPTRDLIANRCLDKWVSRDALTTSVRHQLETRFLSTQALREWYAMRLVYDKTRLDLGGSADVEYVLEHILSEDRTPAGIVNLYRLHLQGPLHPLSAEEFAYRTAMFAPVRYEDRIIAALATVE